ncbi:MAG: diguanylate cyclase [bacterium]
MSEHGNYILAVHTSTETLNRVIRVFEGAGIKVMVCFDSESAFYQMGVQLPECVLVGDRITNAIPSDFCKKLRENPLVEDVMVLMLMEETTSPEDILKSVRVGADGVISIQNDDAVQTYRDELARFRQARFDPLCGVITGAPLLRKLNYLCSSANSPWTFLTVKVLGCRIYNIHRGYDEGSRMLAAVAQMLKDVLHELKLGTDFVGRLHGCRFCIVSTTKRVETLCTKILNNSDRVFRKFYSPFEWVKGYITVEHEQYGGNYHLAELITAGIHVPSGWGEDVSYLLDLSGEVLADVEKEEAGFKIVEIR